MISEYAQFPLILGGSLLLVALVTTFFPPSKINTLYGYRTKRSMKNQDNWDKAQRISTRIFWIQSILIFLLGLGTQFLGWDSQLITIATFILLLGGFAFMMVYTESQLK